MKTKLIIPIIILIIFSICVFAEPEQYLTSGADRYATYQQDGTGQWAGLTPISYQRTYTTIQSVMPLVGDVDNDTTNEIILLADDNLVILNFTQGTGMILEQSITHGNLACGSKQFYITPELFDYDSDGVYEIITYNCSNFNTYGWNGTSIVLEQTQLTLINSTGTTFVSHWFADKSAVKCAPGNQLSSNNPSCIVMFQNRSGASIYYVFQTYDLTTNTISTAVADNGISTAFTGSYAIPHFFDGNNDGYLEVYGMAKLSSAAGDIFIFESSIPTTGTFPATSATAFYYNNGAITALYSDIIVNKLDGYTPAVSFGYSDDGTNFDIRTLKTDTTPTTVLHSSYCTALTCPEGTSMSANVFEPASTTYSDYTGDACIYVRNPTQNDPGVNIDTVYCVSDYAGSGYEETTVSNTVNFSESPVVHSSNLVGSDGLLTSKFLIQGGSKETAVLGGGNNIPVDYQQSGSLDIIGMNTSIIWYYDDNYVNANYEITNLAPNTGNPLCYGYTYTYALTISDDESDAGSCYMEATYANGTSKINDSNTINPFNANQDFYFYADEAGSFVLNFYCKDQYHSAYDSVSYTALVVYSNSTTCNVPGSNPPGSISYDTNTSAAADDDWQASVDGALADLGVVSTKAKSFLGMLILVVLAVGIFYYIRNVIITVLVLVCCTFIMYILGLLTIFPLILIIIVSAALLTFRIVGGGGDPTS